MRNSIKIVVAMALFVSVVDSTMAAVNPYAPAAPDAAVPGLELDVLDIKDTVKKTFTVDNGDLLEVNADMGNVEVRTGDDGVVRIIVERIVKVSTKAEAKSLLEQHHLEMNQKGETVEIHSRLEREKRRWNKSGNRIRVRILVEVPAEYDVEISTAAGNIGVRGVDGEVDIRTGAGNIKVTSLTGEIDITSGSGNIDVLGTEGEITVENGAGNITVKDSNGEMSISTGAGNVVLNLVDQLDGDSKLFAGAGNITAYVGDNVGVEIQAVAKIGSCNTDYPLNVTGNWMKKSFSGSINGGGPELTLIAAVGNVNLKRIRR